MHAFSLPQKSNEFGSEAQIPFAVSECAPNLPSWHMCRKHEITFKEKSMSLICKPDQVPTVYYESRLHKRCGTVLYVARDRYGSQLSRDATYIRTTKTNQSQT